MSELFSQFFILAIDVISFMKKLFIYAVVTLFVPFVHSQDDCGCADALKANFEINTFNKSLAYHWANAVDSNSETEIKLIGGKFNFFGENFESFKSRSEFDFSSDQSAKQVKNYIHPRAYDSYDNCIDACLNKQGLSLYLSRNTADYAIIAFKYTPGSGTALGAKVDKIEYIEVGDSRSTTLVASGSILEPGRTYTKTIRKTRNNKIDVILNVGGNLEILEIQPYSYYETRRLTQSCEAIEDADPTVECVYKFECQAKGDSDVGRGQIIGPLLPQATDQNKIIWGPWGNSECNTSGNGWYINWGSCGTGRGSSIKGCISVSAIVKVTPIPHR